MRLLTAAKSAAAVTSALLLANGTAYALSADKPTRPGAGAGDVRIELGAPVITREDILVHAPLRTVWKIQTDVENRPTWQPDVDTVVKDTPGRLRPGSVFRWTTEGLDITSTVRQADHGKRLAWGGPAQGIGAVHVWTFTPTPDGVLVHTEESWAGDPVTADRAAPQAALDNSLHHWLGNLEREAESQAGT
ncbi:Shy6-polyketide cyclase [Streptomyces bungoensis]|uniref:Shy6-polyketide cyclase n=1 Tax=Streptomyces bungoensis TaxID=285568 RepID=A0A117R8T8_9ACTN|nr:SRPBCC family protein [Streptomyces bungoensis]KUN77416.1 Shy6-polyketide cyclase [Streptomyces bungoensis]